jgi:hypothetical protein
MNPQRPPSEIERASLIPMAKVQIGRSAPVGLLLKADLFNVKDKYPISGIFR